MSSQEVFIFGASFAQLRLWFFEQLVPGNAIYSVPTVIRLHGSLDVRALEFALNEIVRRHETLRTTFTILEEQLVQVITPSLLLSINTLDLRELSAEESEAQAKCMITQEIERPFDLSSEPLLRVILLIISDKEHILLLNMHHIVCDDWSIGVLISELGALYTAKVKNQPSPLLELPLQYADFAEWQREWLTGEVLEKQLAYWRHQLNGITVLPLPTDKRPNVQSHYGATQFLELPLSLVDALEKLSQQEGATLYMTLLAAFQTLLYRYTYSDDIVVGSPIANRNRSEIEGLIGFFVNTLVLRTDFSGNPTFREILGRVREVTLGAYSHQDLPFEKLVEHLQPERNLSASPLFQVVFGFENAPMQELELPGLAPSFMNIDLKTTRFDLELHLWKCSSDFRSLWGGDWQHSDGIRGIVVYNTDLFEHTTISRMLKHFTTLLEGIVANLSERIARLPLLSEAELNQILFEWNDTQSEYPSNQCIHELFERQVEQYRNNIALNYENVVETLHVTSLHYDELNNRSNKLAHHLQKLGVNTEVVVGICAARSIDMIVGMLGILKAGGAYLPLDPSYPVERLNFMLEDSHAQVLLTQENFAKYFENFSHPIVNLDKDWEIIARESKENPNSKTTSDNLAYVIYTSGSTGTPKGVAVTHKAVNRLVRNTNYIKITSNDKIAQVSNTSFDTATFEIWGALLNGAQLIGIDKDIVLSPNEFASQLKQKDISILFLTTALFQKIARDIPQAFSNLRYLLFGGETIDTRWVKKVIQHGMPEQLIHVYGPTENTTFSSYYPIHELPSATSIPIGRPISNTQIYILDANLQPVPIGVTGELYIGGDGLARGYINSTKTQFLARAGGLRSYSPTLRGCGGRGIDGRGIDGRGIDGRAIGGIYKTGDLGRYLPDGNIEFLGRIDNQVKIRGFRIELEEIETHLNQHPAVREAVVIATEDIPGDKNLIAYIVPQQQAPTSTILRAFLKQKLPEYMIPVAYVGLESLPLTPAGKVNRHALPKIDTLNLDVEENYVAPQTDVEQVLVQIWTNILTTAKPIGHDNFFELGGHSLLATQLTSRIRDIFSIDLPLRTLFEAPTIASLAKYIQMRTSTSFPNTNIKREEVEF